MGNNFSTHIEELKAKERQIILISGVKLKSRDVLKTIDKLEAECPNVGMNQGRDVGREVGRNVGREEGGRRA